MILRDTGRHESHKKDFVTDLMRLVGFFYFFQIGRVMSSRLDLYRDMKVRHRECFVTPFPYFRRKLFTLSPHVALMWNSTAGYRMIVARIRSSVPLGNS